MSLKNSNLFVAWAFGDLDWADVGIGHSQIPRLAARKAAIHVRIAKQPSGWTSDLRGLLGTGRIRPLTQ
jgi:hypothetical protein